MEKVTKFDFEAAFKALSDIDIPVTECVNKQPKSNINLNEEKIRNSFGDKTEKLLEDYYNVNDLDDLKAAEEERKNEIAKAKLARIEKIVDLDAKSEEDLLMSYTNKIIIQCPQCMTMFYKDEDDIEQSDADTEMCNVGERCQHCGNESGYILVGKVAPVDKSEAANFDSDELEVEEDGASNDEVPEDIGYKNGDDAELPTNEDEKDLNIEEISLEEPDESKESNENEEDEEEEDEEEEDEDEDKNESLNKSNLLKAAEKDEMNTENHSENLTLNEDINQCSIEECAKRCAEGKGMYLPKYNDINEVVEFTGDGVYVIMGSKPNMSIDGAENCYLYPREEFLGCCNESSCDSLKNYKEELESSTDNVSEEFTQTAEIPSKSELDQLFNSKEFTTEVSDADIDMDEELTEDLQDFEDANSLELHDDQEVTPDEALEDIDSVDEETIEECISEALKAEYSNVANFKLNNFELAGGKIIAEGKINFNSGKSKSTKYIFDRAAKRGNYTVFTGLNEMFGSKSNFTLACLVSSRRRSLIAESFKYKYFIENDLVEGLIRSKVK